MDITINQVTYTLGKIKASKDNMAKLFNCSDNAGTIEGQSDFLDLLEIALISGSGQEKAQEALDNLAIEDIAKSDSEYAKAYGALITMAFGKKDNAKS